MTKKEKRNNESNDEKQAEYNRNIEKLLQVIDLTKAER
jgi:hypothetical protein